MGCKSQKFFQVGSPRQSHCSAHFPKSLVSPILRRQALTSKRWPPSSSNANLSRCAGFPATASYPMHTMHSNVLTSCTTMRLNGWPNWPPPYPCHSSPRPPPLASPWEAQRHRPGQKVDRGTTPAPGARRSTTTSTPMWYTPLRRKAIQQHPTADTLRMQVNYKPKRQDKHARGPKRARQTPVFKAHELLKRPITSGAANALLRLLPHLPLWKINK